ncbi:HesB/YadR/YfhF family protein [Calidifontibacillus oryziterrae]|uniref:HesB/YadR/YfhF family protein n=1 Tax=Calidifontibacillus oryziterrae TaxID=1191699 RepID=UPI0002FABBD5|nr:HesB/YadR/YfhF family protein [Calidifontibacillus oryziterrae]
MELTITKPALEWYKQEMDVANGDFIRFFARYGGESTIQQGFSLGMSLELPNEPCVKVVTDGITFFVEKEDEWYFNDHNLTVVYNKANNEIEFQYN